MRKLIAGVTIALLAATASPAVANGGGSGGGGGGQGNFAHNLNRLNGFWTPQAFFGHGYSSHGKHWGWFHGRHWGWFKPHNPHWPHHPTSP